MRQICYFNPDLHDLALPLNCLTPVQMSKLNVWKPGPVFQHTTKSLRGYLWEDITAQQRPFNYELRSTAQRIRTPGWSPELWCTMSGRQPMPSGPATWHYDGDRRKTKTTHSGDEQTGSSLAADDILEWNTELESSPVMQPADSWAHEGCSSAALGPAVEPPSLLFLTLLSDKHRTMECWQSPQVLPTGLTED